MPAPMGHAGAGVKDKWGWSLRARSKLTGVTNGPKGNPGSDADKHPAFEQAPLLPVLLAEPNPW